MIRQRTRICMLYIIAAFAATFAACNGVNHSAAGVVPNAISPERSAPQLERRALHFAPFAVVNTGNNSVTLYKPGSSSVAATIVDRVNAPKAVAFDKKGDLFIANARSVTEYPPGSTRALRTMTKGIDSPAALAFDRFDNLYVANQGNSTITVLTPTGRLSRTIARGVVVPNALAFDGLGNLYVSNRGTFSGTNSSIAVFPPGKIAARYTIMQAVKLPLAVALDNRRNVYVANAGTNAVTVYGADGTKLKRTISRGVLVPSALAFDSSGDLYVASLVLNRITIYASGGSKVRGSITKGLNYPNAMAFDDSGTLYVSNLRGNAVTAYDPKVHRYLRSVTAGLSQPSAVAFASSDVSLPAPTPTAQPSLLPQMLFVVNDAASEVDAYTLPLGQYASPALRVTNAINANVAEIFFDHLGNFFSDDPSADAVLEFSPPYTAAPTTIPGDGTANACGVQGVDYNDDLYLNTCDSPALSELIPPYTGAPVTLDNANQLHGLQVGFATDPQGDLFVVDCAIPYPRFHGCISSGDILEYQPPISSASLPVLSIPPDVSPPQDELLALDSAGNLFAADISAPNTLRVYAPPYTGSPSAVISHAYNGTINAIALDANGDVFLAGCCSGVVEYVPPYTGPAAATLHNPCCQNIQSSAISASGRLYVYDSNAKSSSSNPQSDTVLEYSPPFSNSSSPSGIACCFFLKLDYQGIAISPAPPGSYYSPVPSPSPT